MAAKSPPAPTAGSCCGSPTRVAFPLRLLDEGEDAREDARLRHPRLVDDQDASTRETAAPLGLEQEPVEGRAPKPGLVAELLRGRARGGGGEDGDSGRLECLGEGVEGGRLAGA